jgi:hypothetical protein
MKGQSHEAPSHVPHAWPAGLSSLLDASLRSSHPGVVGILRYNEQLVALCEGAL